MERRWGKHVWDAEHAGRSYAIHHAIRKYGPDGFSHRVIETFRTKAEALQGEIEWIAHFKSNQKRYGYNMTPGGEDPPHDPEVSRKAANRRWTDPAQRKLASERTRAYLQSHPHPFKGHTPTSRKRLREAAIKRFQDPEQRRLAAEKQKAYCATYGNQFAGRKHSDAAKARQRASAIKRERAKRTNPKGKGSSSSSPKKA